METSKDDERSDDAISIARISEQIIRTIHSGDYDRAAGLIESAREKLPAAEMHRLVALTAVLRRATGELRESIDLMCQAHSQSPTCLPHLCQLADYLMDAEEWRDADVILDKLIALSELKDEYYFINDARMRKIICLKKLNREGEIAAQKAKIPAGTELFMAEGVYRVEDLGYRGRPALARGMGDPASMAMLSASADAHQAKL